MKIVCALLAACLAIFASAQAASLPTIHARPAMLMRQPTGSLPEDQQMALTIILAPRDRNGLLALLHDLYDPASRRYRQFLSVQDFTERFGPAQADYDSLASFLAASGLSVTDTAPNRLTIRVEGAVADIERVFHVRIGLYRHPSEDRLFFAPDREPSLDLAVPLWHVEGLDDYSLPTPQLVRGTAAMAPGAGSGPGGSYLASDMRAAYYGNGPLAGTGQSVALFEFASYQPSDVQRYFNTIGQSNGVPIHNVLLDGMGLCSSICDDGETVVDIVQPIGMAPGLAGIYVYIGSSAADILNRIATDDAAQQISISYAWFPSDPTGDDPIFEEFAAQGQTVFAASGDCGAYVTGAAPTCSNGSGVMPPPFPPESPYVTTVGGSVLTTTGPGGSRVSETAWRSSGGGFADGVAIPSWQVAAVTAASGASPTLRNMPDVAAEAGLDNYLCLEGTCTTLTGGTSYSAPRWAGFMALVNQQAALNGRPPLGLLNPALYAIATSSTAGTALQDITVGGNARFSAVPGYDLVTGLGAPIGPGLIAQLTSPSSLVASIAPSSRSVQLGTTATLFATMINAAPAALGNCRVELPASAPAGLDLGYQTTDPATNLPNGTPNTPVTLGASGGSQSFLLSLTGSTAFNAPGLPIDFTCDGTMPAATVPGVNTIDLAMSTAPVPDIVTLAATPSQDGILHIAGSGAFAVATSNAGADAPITAVLDDNGAGLPIVTGICQTDPASGQCLAPLGASVTLADFAAGATPTFSVFVTANSAIPFDPAASRLFIRFLDAAGGEHGAASVALATD